MEPVTILSLPSDRSEEGHNGQNPMLNLVILKCFFEQLDFEATDFKNFRLVCKTWLQESLSLWRKKVWLNLNCQLRGLDLYLNLLEADNDTYHLGVHPFHRIKLNSWDVNLQDMRQLNFWNNIGKSITHLECTRCSFFTNGDFRRIFFQLTPKLQFLALNLNTYESMDDVSIPLRILFNEENVYEVEEWMENSIVKIREEDEQNNMAGFELTLNTCWADFPLYWNELLAHFPSIKVLKLQNLKYVKNENGRKELTTMFNSLRKLREQPGAHHLTKLEELDILNIGRPQIEVYSSETIENLLQFSFPLKSLSIDIGYQGERTSTDFERLLEAHSQTLKKLVVLRGPTQYYWPFSYSNSFKFELQNLTEIRFVGLINSGLKFLNYTPNLRKLVLMNMNAIQNHVVPMLRDEDNFSLRYIGSRSVFWHSEFYHKDLPIRGTYDFRFYSQLRDLVLPNMEVFIVGVELCYYKDVEALGKLMPNLRIIRMGLDNDSFARVCFNWSETLEHLDITPFNVDELGLLGTSSGGSRFLRPNLTDLKRLKTLSIRHKQGDDVIDAFVPELSDDSVSHGILALPDLKEFKCSSQTMVTNAARQQLCTKFPDCNLEPNDVMQDDGLSYGGDHYHYLKLFTLTFRSLDPNGL